MKFNNARIIQFAKQPVTGRVKTRLMPELGAEKARQVHERLVVHVWRQLNASAVAPVELWVDGLATQAFFNALEPTPARLFVQEGDDLGARMHHALASALEYSEYSILVGSDCPVIDASYLLEAVEALQQGNDVVLGPADDGGYVLIGLSKVIPALFQSIDWGTDRVLAQTRSKLQKAGCSWHELAERWDVDRPGDVHKAEAMGFSLL